jgi:hypothetical protein
MLVDITGEDDASLLHMEFLATYFYTIDSAFRGLVDLGISGEDFFTEDGFQAK